MSCPFRRRRPPDRPRRQSAAVSLAGALLPGFVLAADLASVDDLSRRLQFASADGRSWASASVTAIATVYDVDRPASGLLLTDHDTLFAPVLTATVDGGIGPRLSGHARLTADRGFDPLFEEDGDLRFDEWFIALQLADSHRLEARAGRFPTAFGAWVDRHLAWDNPLISAPLLYDDMLTITDAAAPADSAAFLARRDLAENKRGWVPVVWGPSYATGAALSGGLGDLDLTLEVKNAALSSRPETWNPWDREADEGVTVTGHLRWRPDPAWTLGLSWSDGAYLQDGAEASLPAGRQIDDYSQATAGLDLAYQHRDLQIWSELAHSRFEVPAVGEVSVTSGFVEVRYKVAPRWWLAGRWNQSWFEEVARPAGNGADPGEEISWDRDLHAADVGIGYRHTAHLQGKLEYRWVDQQGTDVNGRHRLTGQLVFWF